MIHAVPPSQIALVTDRWEPGGGGREQYLRDLHAGLRAGGGSVRVFLSRGTGDLRGSLIAWRKDNPTSPILVSRPADPATHYQLHDGLYAAAFAAEAESFDSLLRRRLSRPALAWNRRRAAMLRAEENLLTRPDRPQLMDWFALRDALSLSHGIPSHQIRVYPPGGGSLSSGPSRPTGRASRGAQQPAETFAFSSSPTTSG